MTYIRHIKSLLPLLSALIMALAMTACSLVMEPGYDCDEPGDFIEMKFRIVSGNVISRASDGLSPDVSEWPAFEDYINTYDLAFFIFLKNSDTDMPLLMAVTSPDDQNTSIAGILGEYTLTARIPKEDFESVSGAALTPTSNQMDFRMVVLANTGVDYSLLTATGGTDPIQFIDFIGKAQALSFDMLAAPSEYINDRTGTAYYVTDSGNTSVASLYKGTIPMYGLLNFSVRQDDLYYSTETSHLWIGDIHMLRSLAKIRVIEDFTHGKVDGLPRICSVAVESDKSQGYVLPVSPAAYKNGFQVEVPNIKNGESSSIFTLGSFVGKENLWLGYFPEQSFGLAPVIKITVVWEEDESHNPTVTEVFTVEMNKYPSALGTDMLRNHIYTIIADIAGGIRPTVTIKPYIGVDLDPIFGLTPKEATPPSE